MTAPLVPSATAADHAACRAILRRGSRSFLAASLLLPRRLRGPASALYAFCRVSDDRVDDQEGSSPGATLAHLHERLQRAVAGRPLPDPVDRALADTLRRFSIPAALPELLLEGFAWDLSGRRYETLSALLDYAVRVAGSVGAMMALLMDRREPSVLARAVELGVAMQLTNIARDVGPDAEARRLYLPLDWLREVDLDPDALLHRPCASSALASVLDRLLAEADRLYRSADLGIAVLPPGCRPAIRAAQRGYRAIGDEIRRQGCQALQTRAQVTPWRRLAIIAGAFLPAPPPRMPPIVLPEAQVLLDNMPHTAVVRHSLRRRQAEPGTAASSAPTGG